MKSICWLAMGVGICTLSWELAGDLLRLPPVLQQVMMRQDQGPAASDRPAPASPPASVEAWPDVPEPAPVRQPVDASPLSRPHGEDVPADGPYGDEQARQVAFHQSLVIAAAAPGASSDETSPTLLLAPSGAPNAAQNVTADADYVRVNYSNADVQVVDNTSQTLNRDNVRLAIGDGPARRPDRRGAVDGKSSVTFSGVTLQKAMVLHVHYLNDDGDVASTWSYKVDAFAGPLQPTPRIDQLVTGNVVIDFNSPLASIADTDEEDADEQWSAYFTLVEAGRSLGDEVNVIDGGEITPDRKTVYFNVTLEEGKQYKLYAKAGPQGVQDIYGNFLAPDPGQLRVHLINLAKPLDDGPTANVAGVTAPGGAHVTYPEYTAPREQPEGFNPSDKVESRVSRLYYYRDAHRVAQIINRNVRSFNIAGVEMSRQRADKARTQADEARLQRQQQERKAVEQARETRRLQAQLEQAEQNLSGALRELSSAQSAAAAGAEPGEGAGTGPSRQLTDKLESVVETMAARVDQIRNDVESSRSLEIAANELAIELAAREELAAQEQFRREVAAAKADPNTYAAGIPGSMDPVEQVSVSVIGEGLIHLRGPLKGINIIRQMIDRIDTPVGQVRVQIHTVQVNGEHGDRMEKAATKAEVHIEQARFLTMQSSELLRRAVVQVASRKAEEARSLYPGTRQQDRDVRYLHAFFGQDFINELEVIDSEFLRTGNKLLSLHSMDTTSLSSALTLMALAKNSTRQEILQEFDALVMSELPLAEQRFLEPRLTSCKRCRHLGCLCRHDQPHVCLLAENATFQSLRGFFAAEIAHDETMTPMQREFVRLAQIFKSRLVTELEYKQRVMERALIEERIDTRFDQRRQEAFNKEEKANKDVADAQKKRIQQIFTIRESFIKLNTAIDQIVDQGTGVDGLLALEDFVTAAATVEDLHGRVGKTVSLGARQGFDLDVRWESRQGQVLTAPTPQGRQLLVGEMERATRILNRIHTNTLSQFRYSEDLAIYLRLRRILANLPFEDPIARSQYVANGIPENDVFLLIEALKKTSYLLPKVAAVAARLRSETTSLALMLSQPDVDPQAAYSRWRELSEKIRSSIWPDGASTLKDKSEDILASIETEIVTLLNASLGVDVARAQAELARRPLDEKKFLDMLVDDLEEKYIELLEGTRAHTANIDNYIKRLTTALDDDFNNQFYEPAFKQVRAAGRSWDVQFGQIETTGILANNRSFAKVTPKATMEFDLPARQLLLTEGLQGAKALMDDVGALATDPTFLAMAQLGTPAPVAATVPVDEVLITALGADQLGADANQNQLGAALESLIPDPAIYKFETGTGYEVRPVIQPDGQAVVFDFNYMYTTEVREPVRADEKHLGRVKRHYIDTDVQLSNFELRKISRYQVALKASRTARGVPLLEDVPVVGILFRPLPQQESSLQQNIILGQATIFPTLFDLMGLRWAPAVADLDPLRLSNEEFVVRQRQRHLKNRVYDQTSSQVDKFLRIPDDVRRPDLYRTQETLPRLHPNGYRGDGLDYEDSQLQEGFHLEHGHEGPKFIPGESKEGSPYLRNRRYESLEGYPDSPYPIELIEPGNADPGVEIEVPGYRSPAPVLEPAAARGGRSLRTARAQAASRQGRVAETARLPMHAATPEPLRAMVPRRAAPVAPVQYIRPPASAAYSQQPPAQQAPAPVVTAPIATAPRSLPPTGVGRPQPLRTYTPGAAR